MERLPEDDEFDNLRRKRVEDLANWEEKKDKKANKKSLWAQVRRVEE